MPDPEFDRRDPSTPPGLPLVQREIVLIVVLCLVCAAMFGATRRLAAWVDRTNAAAAAEWHLGGQQLMAAGRVDAGIAALRQATARDPRGFTYRLAMARALMDSGAIAEAWQLLLRLHEANPDQPEVNERLGRLATDRGQRGDAIRYYNQSLIGVPAPEGSIERQRVQAALAGLLIDSQDDDAALAVISAMAREVGDSAAGHREAADLFLRAGDARRALSEFDRAIVLDGRDGRVDAATLEKAGSTASRLGDLRTAIAYLDRAIRAGASAEAQSLLDRTRVVLATDPLSPSLRMDERVRRLRAGLEWIRGRLADCPSATTQDTGSVEAFLRRPAAELRDSEVVAEGVNVIAGGAARVAAACGPADAQTQAWQAIGLTHAGKSS